MTVEEFREKFPKFDCVADSFIELAISTADETISKCAYSSSKRELAICYVVAHECSLEMNGSMTSAMVASEKVGDIQKSYSVGNPDDVDAYYRLTLYGQKYLQLKSTVVTSPFVID